MTSPDGDDLRDLTGDAAGAEILRRSLREVAREHAGTPFGERVSAVLAGRLGIRDLAEDPELVELARAGMAAYEQMWQEMTPDERAAAVEAGQAYEADLEADLEGRADRSR